MIMNECRLQGRLSAAAEERTFPSGDTVVLFRLVVPRSDEGRVDTIDCRVDAARLRKRVLALAPGAELEVVGALHRRFWRSATGPASRYEVLATSVRKCI